MSRIEGKQHVQLTQDSGSNKVGANQAGDGAQSNSAYVANNDSVSDKFNSHEGIERSRGKGHDMHGKKVGDEVEFEDGDNHRHGRILKDNGDSYNIIVGDQVYTVMKDNGKSEGHRQATESEMQQAAQMQAYQDEQARIQEQQSARVDESIKIDNKKHDMQLYNQKVEVRLDSLKKIENRKQAVQSLSDQFQFQTADTEHQTLTVSEIILSRDKEAELKK